MDRVERGATAGDRIVSAEGCWELRAQALFSGDDALFWNRIRFRQRTAEKMMSLLREGRPKVHRLDLYRTDFLHDIADQTEDKLTSIVVEHVPAAVCKMELISVRELDPCA